MTQEFELYWNAEDCAGAYRTDYVIQGEKTFLGVDYWDVTVDSVRFEVNGLADSLYYVDRHYCRFTPIELTRMIFRSLLTSITKVNLLI